VRFSLNLTLVDDFFTLINDNNYIHSEKPDLIYRKNTEFNINIEHNYGSKPSKCKVFPSKCIANSSLYMLPTSVYHLISL